MSDLEKAIDDIQKQILDEVNEKYSPRVVELWMKPLNMGRVEEPDGEARITASCGDWMEIRVRIEDGSVGEISFYTDGCGSTVACGSAVTDMSSGGKLEDLRRDISQEAVLDYLGGLPEENEHCALLAAETLLAALDDYERRRDAESKEDEDNAG